MDRPEIDSPEACETCRGGGVVAYGPWGSRPPRKTCPDCDGSGWGPCAWCKKPVTAGQARIISADPAGTFHVQCWDNREVTVRALKVGKWRDE